MPKTHFTLQGNGEFFIMAKIQKPGQVGNRMSEAEKAKANAARLAKAAKLAAKTSGKSKTAKKTKSVFKAVQAKKIVLAVFVGLIPTNLVEPTWDNAQDFVEKPRAVKKVAPSVKTKPVVKGNTGTVADKFAPSANKAVDPIINNIVDDNKELKDALRKVMYDTFYKQQQEAVADLIFARKSEIHAAYVAQYEAYKQEIKSVISVVTDDIESIKAQVNLDLNAWADQEVQAYESELAADFERVKPNLMQEVLDELALPFDSSIVTTMIADAKAEAEAAKQAAIIAAKLAEEAEAKAKAERAAKAMELYKAEQVKKAEAAAKAKANKAKQDTAKYLADAKSFARSVDAFIADGGDVNASYKAHLNTYKQLIDNCQVLFDAGKYEEALLATKKFYAVFKRELEALIGYMKSVEADKTAKVLQAIERFKKTIKVYKAELLIPQAKRESGMSNHEIMIAIRDLNAEISAFEAK